MEEGAHLGDVSHKSHPLTGLLQDRVSVHEAPGQRLQPHSSTSPEWQLFCSGLTHLCESTEALSLGFQLLQEVALKNKKQKTVQNTKDITSS